MKKILNILMIMMVSSVFAIASSGGNSSSDFLKLGVEARALGMGSAYAAVSDDVHAVYWNPAGLADCEGKQLSLSHLEYVAEINYENIEYAQEMFGGVVGVDFRLLHVEDERRNKAGDKIGTFMDYNRSIGLAYGFVFNDNLNIGFGMKFITICLDGTEGSSVGFDGGLLYKISDELKAAAVVQNVGDGLKLGYDKSDLPTNLKVGVSYLCTEKMLVAADINSPIYGEKNYSLGCEYSMIEAMKLRTGYKLREEGNELGGLDGFSAGLGFSYNKYTIDYAYVPFGEFDDTHRVTLSMKW